MAGSPEHRRHRSPVEARSGAQRGLLRPFPDSLQSAPARGSFWNLPMERSQGEAHRGARTQTGVPATPPGSAEPQLPAARDPAPSRCLERVLLATPPPAPAQVARRSEGGGRPDGASPTPGPAASRPPAAGLGSPGPSRPARPGSAALEALGPGGERASPASSTRSLDLRRLSARADSAYSSFSAASGDAEPRSPSPGAEHLPYLDWGFVRAVRGGPAPSAAPAGPLSRQATPLLFALAAEARAGGSGVGGSRAALEPPSPPASRAAYRRRLQGAQRRVLRETSFQRKELGMSLPARLRPALPAPAPAAHLRSASLGHPDGDRDPDRDRDRDGEAAPPRARAPAPAPGPAGPPPPARQPPAWCPPRPARQPPACCSSDPAGRGGRPSGGSLARPEPPELQPETQPRSTSELDPRPRKLGSAHGPASRSRSASGEAAGPRRGAGGTEATVQAGAPGPESPRSLSRPFRFLAQKEAALAGPAEVPQSSPASCERRAPESCVVSARLPSLPDDDVFLEEPLLARAHASDQQSGTDLGQRAGQATAPPDLRLHGCAGTAGADDQGCWPGGNGSVGSVGVSRPVSCSFPGAANGDTPAFGPAGLLTADPTAAAENEPPGPPPVDAPEPAGRDTPGSPPPGTCQPGCRPARPGGRLQELVQELARLDPSLSDTLAAQPSPELVLSLLDGLIPLAELRAAMKPLGGEAGEGEAGEEEAGEEEAGEEAAGEEAAGEEAAGEEAAGEEAAGEEEAGEEAAGPPAPGTVQLLRPSQEDSRPEDSPDRPSGRRLPAPTLGTQAPKAQLAGLLQEMLQDLGARQGRLQAAAGECARRQAGLEAAVGRACAPRERERFRRFMADLERVLGLLLLLASRLARVRGALARAGPDGDPDERASLRQRLGLLRRQEEDARELREHVARRERALRAVLARALPAPELRSYRDLLATKAAVLARQRSLDQRVRLLQDQLDAVRSDLGRPAPCPRPRPPGACPPEGPPPRPV